MSDIPNGAAAPAAPDSGAAPAPEGVTHTEHEVAGVLAKMLDGDEGDDTESPEAGAEPASDDLGPDESPATEDEPDSEPEAPAAPIEPPTGWTGKDTETWQTLPPAAQEIIRRRDSEMAAAVTRATQERAEYERIMTPRLEQAANDRVQYQQNLAAFGQALLPRARELASVNWTQVAAENPAEYVRLQAEYQAMQQYHQQIQGEMQRIQHVSAQQAAEAREQQKRFSHQQLVAERPEFADPRQAQEIGGRLGQFLRGFGFGDQEIVECIDHRAIKLALAAMEASERQSAVASANAKRSPAPAPQVQRPGSSRTATNGSRMTQLADRFDKAPTVENAARIVAQWLQ